MAEFSSYRHGTPCWVDVTSDDLAATNAFYGRLFGWSAKDMGEASGGYTMYTLRGKNVAAGSPPPPGAEGMPPHWTTDPAAAGAFYAAVFGCGYEERPMTEGGPRYGVLSVDGRGVAGVLQLEGEMAGIPPNWSPVFSVADTDETVAKAQELAGTALMPGMDLPEIGRLAVIQDPAGAVFQVLQPPPE